jgi:hypothetical protein
MASAGNGPRTMAIDLNGAFRGEGTRFRIFAQPPVLDSVVHPETVWLSKPPGSIGPGPEDDRIFVSDALDKAEPYGAPFLPPYRGQKFAPAIPDAHGHFDHIPVLSREFRAAHMYAAIRRVLDVWECYFGRPIEWHFRELYSRLELIPHLHWDNAQSGFGFIETGYRENDAGELQLFCLNFDVLAHELGHSVIYSEVGTPNKRTETPQYFGFQESAADMSALIAALHFESVVDRLLRETSGNLYVLNELNRVAELSQTEQIRIASNDAIMSDYAAGWEKEHHLSQPLTGALFDILVDVFQEYLAERGLISRALADTSFVLPDGNTEFRAIQRSFDDAYARRHHAFKDALLDARDYVGGCLAFVWERLSADYLTYVDVGHLFLDADRVLARGRFEQVVFESFAWREIGSVEPGPRLGEPIEDGIRSCR